MNDMERHRLNAANITSQCLYCKVLNVLSFSGHTFNDDRLETSILAGSSRK